MKNQIDIKKIYKKATNWFSRYKKLNSKNSTGNVLLMLSGGNDSVTSLAILKSLGISVTAIHFYHKWSWENSRKEARRAARFFGVPLIEVNMTRDLYSKIKNFKGGRPCRLCKPIMYVKSMDYAKKHHIRWIAVGDNNSDTVVNRVALYEEKRGNRDYHFSRYLDCIEQGIKVYRSIDILRPIIDLNPEEVKNLLSRKFHYKVIKNNETGDKYFGYWREGCPLQYADPGFVFSYKNMDRLYAYNKAAVDFAKKYHIRASVNLPSMNLVTIPKNYEEKLRSYLKEKGFTVNEPTPRSNKRPYIEHYMIECFEVNKYYITKGDVFAWLAKRFAERIKVNVVKSYLYNFKPQGITFIMVLSSSHMVFQLWPEYNYLQIDLLSCTKINRKEKLEDIVFEVFKAPRIKIRKFNY